MRLKKAENQDVAIEKRILMKHHSANFVLRGSVQLVAAEATQLKALNAKEFATVSIPVL